MKKIFIALAVLASVQIAGAQVKPDAAKKALDAAVEASQNAKKATKAATWTALGKAYVTAYDAPAGNIWQGATFLRAADLNSDGMVDITDVNVLINKILHKWPAFRLYGRCFLDYKNIKVFRHKNIRF